MRAHETSHHIPVLLHEALDALTLQPGMTVVDATLGGGSYTRAIHDRIMPGGRVIAIDRDADAIARFAQNNPHLCKDITLVHENYAEIQEICRANNVQRVDGIVADLGISSDQLDRADRGFSFLHDGPIDMRMDKSDGVPASEIVNHYPREQLIDIVRTYGDEKHAVRIVDAIIAQRPFVTTGELSQAIMHAIPSVRHGRLHPATKTFQALRIVTNDEYAHIEKFLHDAIDVLASGGRLSVVSFHSGEDRIVKNIFRKHARACTCPQTAPVCQCSGVARVRIISRQSIAATAREKEQNVRSRSARLRIVEKI